MARCELNHHEDNEGETVPFLHFPHAAVDLQDTGLQRKDLEGAFGSYQALLWRLPRRSSVPLNWQPAQS